MNLTPDTLAAVTLALFILGLVVGGLAALIWRIASKHRHE